MKEHDNIKSEKKSTHFAIKQFIVIDYIRNVEWAHLFNALY